MKSILFTYLILLSFVVQAQQIAQKPNYTEIGTLLKSPGENNFVNLLSRLQSSDTTVSEYQYYVLYYGQSLQDNYSPYTLHNKHLFDLLKDKQNKEFINQSITYLKQAPFDLQIREYLVNQLYQTGDTSNFMIQVKVLNGFIDALLQTGLGRSEENSIHVMAVTDEYVFLNILGLKYNSRKTQSPYDIFFLDENRYGLTEIYFDASVPLQNLNNMLNAKY